MLDSQVIDNPILQRLRENVFVAPFASRGKDDEGLFTSSFKCDKDVALTMPLIQFNGPLRRAYMSFDVDRPLAGLAWDDANLPVPTMVITNPENGHAHLVYEIANPVWFPKKGHQGKDAPPVRYWKAVYAAIRKALGADDGYTGLLTKNPLHPSWQVSYGPVTPYSLSDLSAHLDLSWAGSRCATIHEGRGRRDTLFQTGRRFAYNEKPNHSTLESFRKTITDELHRINASFSKGPESHATIRSTAKSIANWVWKRHDRWKRNGIMGLDPNENLTVKQKMGQDYTCGLRLNKTFAKIKAAFTFVQQNGWKVTKCLVAKHAGVHRHTVRAYWSQLMDCFTTQVTEQVSSTDTYTVTSVGETECLRHESLAPPKGAQPGGIPDTPNYTPQSSLFSTLRAETQAVLRRLITRGVFRSRDPQKFDALFTSTRERPT